MKIKFIYKIPKKDKQMVKFALLLSSSQPQKLLSIFLCMYCMIFTQLNTELRYSQIIQLCSFKQCNYKN